MRSSIRSTICKSYCLIYYQGITMGWNWIKWFNKVLLEIVCWVRKGLKFFGYVEKKTVYMCMNWSFVLLHSLCGEEVWQRSTSLSYRVHSNTFNFIHLISSQIFSSYGVPGGHQLGKFSQSSMYTKLVCTTMLQSNVYLWRVSTIDWT